MTFPNYGKIKNVPNHQAVIYIYIYFRIYIYISTIFLFNGWFAYSPFLHADRCTQNQPASSYLCALWLSRLKLIPLNKHIEHDMFIYVHHRFLGKLSYFTNLNSSAILGWFPYTFTMIPVRENRVWSWSNLPRYIYTILYYTWLLYWVGGWLL